jgi:hypothetical protein
MNQLFDNLPGVDIVPAIAHANVLRALAARSSSFAVVAFS